MSLTTKDTASIIDKCDFYKDHIERPEYIDPWTMHPRYTYNADRRCRQLREHRSLYIPDINGSLIDTPFNYRNNSTNSGSIKQYGIEPFKNSNDTYIILILIIILFLCIRKN